MDGDSQIANLTSTLDFSSIDEMDPSLAEGHRIFYEREVPFELRSADGIDAPQLAFPGTTSYVEQAVSCDPEVGALEAIKVKILVIGDDGAYTAMRVELSSESNLFFHYTHDLDDTSFRSLQEGQKLMVDFTEYPSVLVRMLNHCIKEPHSHLAVFVMNRDGSARLDFIQNMEYKFVELLSCHFLASGEDIVRQQITFRYNSVKSRLALMQARLADVNALVKIKNPSLLLQLQRTPQRMPPGANARGGRPY